MTLTESRIQELPARPARQDAARPLTKDEEQARLVAAAQAQRLRDLWCESRDAARNGTKGSPAFARVADLAAAYAAMAVRAGERQKARAVVGDALTTLRAACVADRADPARHLAFARTLELAAAYEVAGGDARAAFDALRAAIATIGPFSASLRDKATDPLVRMALAGALVRPISTAARMIDDADQRRMAFRQIWDEARGWAKAAKGAADHASAIELAVVAALDLAVEETAESASDCLERCEELRPHIEALHKVRGDDVVVRTHRAAFARLAADAWKRLGDGNESARLLREAESHLAAAARMPGADLREIDAQRAAIARQRGG
jgi:hypothetical protein